MNLKAVTLDALKDYQSSRSREVRERPINLELQILVSTLKEANLWTRPLAEHCKRLREPDSEVGRALTIDELVRLESTAATNEAWEVAYCAELIAANTGPARRRDKETPFRSRGSRDPPKCGSHEGARRPAPAPG